MSLPRLVLCLSLLVSSLGFAQPPEEWTPYTPPAPETTTPPPLVPAPMPPEPQPAPRPPEAAPPEGELFHRSRRIGEGTQTVMRLMITPWAGVVTGMMGLIGGLVPTAILAIPFCSSSDFQEERCRFAVLTGMTVSYTVGVTMGVNLVGSLMRGRGDGMATYLGALSGAAAGAGIGIASGSTAVLILALSLGPLLGSVVSYEISHAVLTRPETPELQARSGFHVMPVVGATPRGGLLGGLAGRF